MEKGEANSIRRQRVGISYKVKPRASAKSREAAERGRQSWIYSGRERIAESEEPRE